MSTKKSSNFIPGVIIVVIVLLLGVCGLFALPMLAARGLLKPPATSTPISSEPVTGGGSSTAVPTQVAVQQARLVAVSGMVSVMRSGKTLFEIVSTSTLVGEGDVVRTGADGAALIVFADNTEATLSPNSQLAINTLQREQSGVMTIHLLQYIGSIFHRANFDTAGSSYEVITPSGVAAIRGTAFYTDAIFTATANMTPAEIANWIAAQPFFQNLGFSETEITSMELNVTYDISSGQVTLHYLDTSGNTQTIDLAAGQVVTFNPIQECQVPAEEIYDDESQCQVSITTGVNVGVSQSRCGDSVCDPYNETNATCSEDCP